MAHITGEDWSQLLLLPDAVDDYVRPDNPVRFIEAFVDGLDLEAAGFQRVQRRSKGRPGYDPADLLKLYIYGYLNRIRSSRRLEAETHRNLELIWLIRQLRPDFKTIADFRRDNRSAFRAVFRQFVRLCRALDLYGRELIAVDGTRIKAVNNRDRTFTRATLKREFQYDAATDTCRCPAGERLVPGHRASVDKLRAGTYLISYVNRAACRGCGLRGRCTKRPYRRLTRFENESTMERMAVRLAARPGVMARRRESVEHPFGSIKQWMGQGEFLTPLLSERSDNSGARTSP